MRSIINDGDVGRIFGKQSFGLDGSSYTVLCFHGSGRGALAGWEDLVELLSTQHCVVKFDRDEHNTNPAEHVRDISAYLLRNNLHSPYILVAHSYGGVFAKQFLHDFRSKVIGTVLIETGKASLPDKTRTALLRKARSDSPPVSVIRGNSLLESWKKLETNGSQMAELELEQKKAWLEKCDAEDERFEKEQLALSQKYHYVHLPDCGHNVIRERPDIVLHEIQWIIDNQQVAKPDSRWSSLKTILSW